MCKLGILKTSNNIKKPTTVLLPSISCLYNLPAEVSRQSSPNVEVVLVSYISGVQRAISVSHYALEL